LGIDGGTIGNVTVINGESLLGFIDTYTIGFSINNPNICTSANATTNNVIPSKNIAN
jgi:hypothetical protein